MELTVSGFRSSRSRSSSWALQYTVELFTALNDGLTSAAISFLRTLVFQVAAVLLLPTIWDIDGIWMSIVVAEFMAVVLTAAFLATKRRKYHY
ncbi:MAG: hypothetical protein ACLUEK_00265 [Oscillospiraceae bacterium]